MAKLACFLGVRRTSETHKSDLVSFASWAVFSCSLPASCLQTVWHAALVLPSNCLRVELPICMRSAWIITSLHQDRLLAVILSLGMIWTTANFYMIKPYPCFQVINHANHPSNHIYDICNSDECCLSFFFSGQDNGKTNLLRVYKSDRKRRRNSAQAIPAGTPSKPREN